MRSSSGRIGACKRDTFAANLRAWALGSSLIAITVIASMGSVKAQSQTLSPEKPTLSLTQAISRAVAASPKLEAAASSIAAAAGTEQQTKLYPNPTGSVQLENFGGAGPASGFSATETTVGISQLIELGGKRAARQSAALAGRQAAEVDAAAAKLDLAKDVTVAYSQAVAAQDGVSIALETEAAARQVLADVSRRVAAARDPLFQRSKAQVAYSSSMAARQVAELNRTAALQRLARFWGAQTVEERLTDQNVAQADRPQPLAAYEARYRSAPDFARFERLSEMRAAELRLAEANAVPDVTASTGVRQTAGIGGVTFLAGISVPIPILNQNQGEIARAQAELRKVAQDRRQWEIERTQALIAAWTSWQSAWQEANSIRDQSLPQSETAYQQALAGYRSGAFEYLEVLDAQRSFFEQKSNYIAVLARLQTARAETERLAPSEQTQTSDTGPER